MSFRPALRAARVPAASVRGFASSAPRRAQQEAKSGFETEETFFNSTWINAFFILGVGFLGYKYLPRPSPGPASSSLNNDKLTDIAENKDGKVPFLTRLLAQRMVDSNERDYQRGEKHLELSLEAADTRLLFQEAELPKVWRLTYPSSFEQASPHSIGVGTQIDLSDLVVVPSNEQ